MEFPFKSCRVTNELLHSFSYPELLVSPPEQRLWFRGGEQCKNSSRTCDNGCMLGSCSGKGQQERADTAHKVAALHHSVCVSNRDRGVYCPVCWAVRVQVLHMFALCTVSVWKHSSGTRVWVVMEDLAVTDADDDFYLKSHFSYPR